MDLDSLIENVLNAVTAGITVGCIYGLMCIGLGLIFGIMKVVNFAQGELLMLGMFTSLYLVTGGGILAVSRPLYRPVRRRHPGRPDRVCRRRAAAQVPDRRVSGLRTVGSLDEGHFGQLIVTLGISLILQNGGLIVFGSTPVTVRTPLVVQRDPGSGRSIGDATIFLNKAQADRLRGRDHRRDGALLGPGIHPARQGAARGGRQSDGGDLHGYRRRRRYRMAFGLGSGITAIAGGLMATYLSFGPFIGFDYVIIMYSGVVLGGIGSIMGAFWGGMTVGMVQQMSALVLPPQLQNAAIFVVFLLIVLLRPQGLFGRSAERA